MKKTAVVLLSLLLDQLDIGSSSKIHAIQPVQVVLTKVMNTYANDGRLGRGHEYGNQYWLFHQYIY